MSYERMNEADTQILRDQEMQFELKKAGFWTRFWVYCIDLLVISAIGGILIKPVFYLFDLSVTKPFFILLSPYKSVMLLITLVYFLLMTMFFKQTIGKMVLGIKVVSENGQPLTVSALIFREVIGRFISKVLVIPYLLAAFTPNKQTLHDLFADTYVVHEQAYERKGLHLQSENFEGQQLQEHPHV